MNFKLWATSSAVIWVRSLQSQVLGFVWCGDNCSTVSSCQLKSWPVTSQNNFLQIINMNNLFKKLLKLLSYGTKMLNVAKYHFSVAWDWHKCLLFYSGIVVWKLFNIHYSSKHLNVRCTEVVVNLEILGITCIHKVWEYFWDRNKMYVWHMTLHLRKSRYES